MKTLEIELYEYKDLVKPENSEMLKKVINKNYDINVDYEWWEFTYESAKDLLSKLGIEAEVKGFNIDRANYVTIDMDVNFYSLYDSINNQTYLNYLNIAKEYGIMQQFSPIDKRVLKLIEDGTIRAVISVHPEDSRESFDVDVEFEYTNYNALANINKELDKIKADIEGVLKDLNDMVLQMLNDEYDYLTSEQAILDTIESNEYTFDENGKIY